MSHVFNFDLPNVSETYVPNWSDCTCPEKGLPLLFTMTAKASTCRTSRSLHNKRLVWTHEWHFPAIPEPRVPGRRRKSNAQRSQRSNPQRDQESAARGIEKAPTRQRQAQRERTDIPSCRYRSSRQSGHSGRSAKETSEKAATETRHTHAKF